MRDRPGADNGRRPPRPIDEASRPAIDRVLGYDALLPSPDDFGPLQPGEEQELDSFMRARMPRVYRRLQDARRRDPAGSNRRMEEMIPRLRHLKRLVDQNPALGERMIRHAQNMMAMRMARQVWENRPGDRPQLRRRIRAWIAENYGIELDAAEDHLAELKQSRDQRVDALFELFQDPDANLEGEPASVRDLASRLRDAQDDSQRTKLRERLRALAAKRIDAEIEHRGDRVARMRRARPDEINKRYNDMMQQIEAPTPERHAAPRDRRGRP